MLKVGFLASRNGSGARAIVAAAKAGDLAVDPRLVVSNRRDAHVLAWAADQGIATAVIATTPDPETADARLAETLQAHGVELVVMSGYLRRLGPSTLTRYAGRILNIHPGPLPEFGGQGMYGRKVHEAVIASGRRQSAIVIHLVDEEYDHGPEIARLTVEVALGETVDGLEASVRAAEPGFFVETLKRIAGGEIRLP